MSDTVRLLLPLAFPAGVCLLAISAAAMFFGADIPASKAYFASVIVFIAGLGVMTARSQIPLRTAWAGFFCLAALTALTAMRGQLDTATPELAALGAAGALWLVARHGAKLERGGVMLWRASLLAGVLIALWAFVNYTLSPETLWGTEKPYHRDRVTGGFLSANTAATFFGLVSLMGLAELLIQLKRAFSRHALGLSLSLVATLLPATCLVLTASRAGIAFTGFAALMLTVWQIFAITRGDSASRRSLGLAAAGGGAFIVLAGLVWTVSGELAASRFDRVLDDTARQTLFEAYWQGVALAPVLGHGLGSFVFTNEMIATSRNADILQAQGAAHNVYLQWLLQAGWLGALAMWSVIAAMLYGVFQGLKRRRSEREYLRAVLAISVLVLLHGLTDYALEVPGFMWWWAWILGLGAGIAAGGRAARKADRQRQGRQTGRLAQMSAIGLASLMIIFSGWILWQAHMRHDANSAYRLSPEAIAGLADQDALPPSAYLQDALAVRAIETDIGDLDFAERATRAALDREPRLVSSWNRLVYIDLAQNGRLTAQGREALEQSLYLSPYGQRDMMRWRLQIAALAWSDLDEGMRRQLLSQALVLSRRRTGRVWLESFQQEAPDAMAAELQALLGNS